MVEIKTLNDVTFEELESTFNLAFSKYYLRIHFSKEQLEQKYKSENGDWDLSVGVFEDGKLVGFIMHYVDVQNDKKIVYNGGTGVVPHLWGQGLAKKMYDFILPILKENKVDRLILEVLDMNAPAINVYNKVGFEKVRTLNCYKGKINIEEKERGLDIRKIEDFNWSLMKGFWDYTPTWQNSILALDNLKDVNNALGAFIEDELVGYSVFNPKTKRISQIAVHKDHRRKGLATALMAEVAKEDDGDFVIINVDDRMMNSDGFLRSLGMEKFIVQNEMEMGM